MAYTTESFTEKATALHNGKYEGWDKKVCIICPIHSEGNMNKKRNLIFKTEKFLEKFFRNAYFLKTILVQVIS